MAYTLADFQQAQLAIRTASADGISNLALAWASLAGDLQYASEQLTLHQGALLEGGWNAPSTESFNNYVAALQARAAALFDAAGRVAGTLYTASGAVTTATDSLAPLEQSVYACSGDAAVQQAALNAAVPQADRLAQQIRTAYTDSHQAIAAAKGALPIPTTVATSPRQAAGDPGSPIGPGPTPTGPTGGGSVLLPAGSSGGPRRAATPVPTRTAPAPTRTTPTGSTGRPPAGDPTLPQGGQPAGPTQPEGSTQPEGPPQPGGGGREPGGSSGGDPVLPGGVGPAGQRPGTAAGDEPVEPVPTRGWTAEPGLGVVPVSDGAAAGISGPLGAGGRSALPGLRGALPGEDGIVGGIPETGAPPAGLRANGAFPPMAPRGGMSAPDDGISGGTPVPGTPRYGRGGGMTFGEPTGPGGARVPDISGIPEQATDTPRGAFRTPEAPGERPPAARVGLPEQDIIGEPEGSIPPGLGGPRPAAASGEEPARRPAGRGRLGRGLLGGRRGRGDGPAEPERPTPPDEGDVARLSELLGVTGVEELRALPGLADLPQLAGLGTPQTRPPTPAEADAAADRAAVLGVPEEEAQPPRTRPAYQRPAGTPPRRTGDVPTGPYQLREAPQTWESKAPTVPPVIE